MPDILQIEEAMKKSTPQMREMLFSPDIGDFLYKIAEEHRLDEEKTLYMIDEVGYVILSLKERDTFADSLVKIGIEHDISIELSKKIEARIFTFLKPSTEKPASSKDIPETTTQSRTPIDIIPTYRKPLISMPSYQSEPSKASLVSQTKQAIPPISVPPPVTQKPPPSPTVTAVPIIKPNSPRPPLPPSAS